MGLLTKTVGTGDYFYTIHEPGGRWSNGHFHLPWEIMLIKVVPWDEAGNGHSFSE